MTQPTMRLSATQREALQILLDAYPKQVRAGVGFSTTCSSLVGRGYVRKAFRPAGERGSWYILTIQGVQKAESLKRKLGRAAWSK